MCYFFCHNKILEIYRPQIISIKSAARRVNYVNTTSSEEDNSDVGNKETLSSSSEEEQLDLNQYDAVIEEPPRLPLRARTPPKIIFKDGPPRITILLFQIDRDIVNTLTTHSHHLLMHCEPSAARFSSIFWRKSLFHPILRWMNDV